MNQDNDSAPMEIAKLQSIVDALDSVYSANWDRIDGVDLNRLSTARGEAAFLLDRAKRRVGREAIAA